MMLLFSMPAPQYTQIILGRSFHGSASLSILGTYKRLMMNFSSEWGKKWRWKKEFLIMVCLYWVMLSAQSLSQQQDGNLLRYRFGPISNQNYESQNQVRCLRIFLPWWQRKKKPIFSGPQLPFIVTKPQWSMPIIPLPEVASYSFRIRAVITAISKNSSQTLLWEMKQRNSLLQTFLIFSVFLMKLVGFCSNSVHYLSKSRMNQLPFTAARKQGIIPGYFTRNLNRLFLSRYFYWTRGLPRLMLQNPKTRGRMPGFARLMKMFLVMERSQSKDYSNTTPQLMATPPLASRSNSMISVFQMSSTIFSVRESGEVLLSVVIFVLNIQIVWVTEDILLRSTKLMQLKRLTKWIQQEFYLATRQLLAWQRLFMRQKQPSFSSSNTHIFLGKMKLYSVEESSKKSEVVYSRPPRFAFYTDSDYCLRASSLACL